MSSVIFQPLLHDPLGWKSSNTTYMDTFKWRKARSSSTDKRISKYGQKYQRELRKQQKLQQINKTLPIETDQEQTIQLKKTEENRGVASVSYRSSPSKTPPVVSEEPPAVSVEYKQRSASTNREATCGSKTSHRSLTVPNIIEELKSRSTTSLDTRRTPSKEEKEKVILDPNNDNTRHWLAYPNPKTPQYLIDIKQRLGQLKVPAQPNRPTSATNTSIEQTDSSAVYRLQQQQQLTEQKQQQQQSDQRHFLDFSLPETPNDLRAARHRLDKYRYNPSLDNYLQRPKTCPVRTSINENSKPITPPNASESNDEQSPPTQLPPPSATAPATKEDVWTNDEENKDTENETSSTLLIQMVDCDELPNDYYEALEVANIVQDEYLKNFKSNEDKQSDNFVYRLPSMPTDHKTRQYIAYRTQQQSTSPTTNNNNNNNSTNQNDFGAWVRNASERERESAMKILQDVLHQPIVGYDIPIKSKIRTTTPILVRTKSATRKLGRTRTSHPRIPCEICEKEFIKQHLWNLNQPDTIVCPHQAQGMKPPIIQVRA